MYVRCSYIHAVRVIMLMDILKSLDIAIELDHNCRYLSTFFSVKDYF